MMLCLGHLIQMLINSICWSYLTGFARRGLIRAPLQNTDFTTILCRIHHQTIHVCMFCGQQLTSLLSLRLLSEPCQTSMNVRFVLSCLCWLFMQQRLPGCEVSHDLVVILSTDLTTFWANSITSGSIKQV